MRRDARVGCLWAALFVAQIACGQTSDPVEPPTPSVKTKLPGAEGEIQAPGAEAETKAGASVESVALEVEFHRARPGLGPGFWILAVVHNPGDRPVASPTLKVKFLDEERELVGESSGRLHRLVAPGEHAPIAVRVADPVAHEHLELEASGGAAEGPVEPLPLTLEHDDPMRAELGGWIVFGRVTSTATQVIRGARVEIQGLDEAGQLLGLDWYELDEIDPGETVEFDVGGLRYEEPPKRFTLVLRPPKLE